MCGGFPSGVTGTLMCGTSRGQRWHSLKKKKKMALAVFSVNEGPTKKEKDDGACWL